MYSRYHDRADRPMQIPENYSGCAFSDLQYAGDSAHSSPHRIDVAKPTPPDRDTSHAIPSARMGADRSDAHEPPRKRALPPSPLPPPEKTTPSTNVSEHAVSAKKPKDADDRHGLLEHLGTAFPFSHGIGFDELLILGMILLLSQNETDSDLILWLLLLLFSG
ncbi:MAG: hypothetical protein E7666_06290 [Ruminococcaceae bacterium]|nr:hypothetical protein [Oscillospiraceae bacterium]